MLYEKHNYLDKTVPYLISHEIIEYDMREAGYSLCKEYKLLDDSKLEYLSKLDKKSRHIQIGLYQRDDSEFKLNLNEKFKEMRGLFFNANDIKDEEVLSISKDAIYVLRRCLNTDFGEVHFIEKHEYTSYYNINNIEFYVGDNYIDVKGISDSKLEKHKKYMLNFLYIIFKMMETSSRKTTIRNLKEFALYYKNRELHPGYYRELNSDSILRLSIQGMPKVTLVINDDTSNIQDASLLDISYNYLHYINPIISLLI